MRIGNGYDVHRLVEGRKLILGGVTIPYEYGLLGHSDADVLTHAIMDALIGAIGKGDIGVHFPDSAKEYEDISSIKLLSKVLEMVEESMYTIENIDAIIVAEKPKLIPYIEEMKKNLALALKISESQINIKATTEEGLGFTGDGRGIKAYAVVLVNEMLYNSYFEDYSSCDGGCGGCGGCR